MKEYDDTYQIPIEFRLIKDPCGLMDLRNNLVDRWEPLNVDIAIKKFLWHCNYLNIKSKKIPTRFGLGYSKELGNGFNEATQSFINELCPKKYYGDWFYFHYGQNSFKLFIQKIKKKIFHINYSEKMYYSDVCGDEFDLLSKKYINSIFYNHNNGANNIILDQAVPAQDPLQAEHYFDDYKIIIVNRDARDNYCDLINNHGLIGDELRKNNDLNFYINWFMKYRENKEIYLKNPNIKWINFEDLICNYDVMKEDIEKFVGLKPSQHINIKKYFNPLVSKKNIGIWKEYQNQDVIQKIKELLSDFISEYAD